MTAVLCECAFIDNAKDNKIINTVDKQKAFGVAYAKAILEFLEIPYKENSTPTSNVIYTVQVGSYKNKENAENMMVKLKNTGFSGAFIKKV